jgi:Dyp-type peroxidase family
MTPKPSTDELLSISARSDIQGLVTSGFGHLPCSAWLFIQFDGGHGSAAKLWLRNLLPTITSAAPWPKASDGTKLKPARTLNLGFTRSGLKTLGLSASCLDTFPAEFLQGMTSAERSEILGDCGDSEPAGWHVGGPNNPTVDAVLFISTDAPAGLEVERDHLKTGLRVAAGVRLVAEESGSQWPDGREPFGFRDGISAPAIKGITGRGVNTGEFILGYPNEYGFHSVGPVVPETDDPHGLLPESANPYRAGLRDLGLNGSFVVYRKLEQDVAGFWRFLEAESLRHKGQPDPAFMVWLAAKLVGRWPSGAPLTRAPDVDNPLLRDLDDFLYATDPRGRGCPFGAHIRRMNPRDRLRPAKPAESLRMTARHQILRRGKPYGQPLFDPTVLDRLDDLDALRAIVGLRDDGRPRGLHFVSVHASIKSQFEFIQQSWSNNPHFNGLTDNRDPLIGNNGDPDNRSSMLIPREGLDLRTAPLPRFVTVRGGVYLFMPSRRALEYLAAAPNPTRDAAQSSLAPC